MIDGEYWAQFGDHLSADELSRVIRRSRLTTYRWLREGVVPGHHISGIWVVFTESVGSFLEKPDSPFALPEDYLAQFPEEMSPADLVKLLGVDRKTVYKFLDNGVLPGRRVGGFWMVYKSEVTRMLSETSNGNPGMMPRPRAS